jgi:hypothetical protein
MVGNGPFFESITGEVPEKRKTTKFMRNGASRPF